MTKRNTKLSIKKYQLLVATALVLLLVVIAWLTIRQPLAGTELHVFRTVNNLSDIWHIPMLLVTQFGSAGALLVTVITAFLLRKRLLALQLALSGTLTYVAVSVLKLVIGRPRPFELFAHVHERELLVHGLGFPSGHAAMAAALSVTFALCLKGTWRLLPIVWIPLVSLSRIYLGVHSPLDVAGGVVLGILVAWLAASGVKVLSIKLMIKA